MRAGVLCVALWSALVAGVSDAEPPPAGEIDSPERARALELGRQGLALYNERRWPEAYERFERAEALVHSPVFLLYMARAKRQLRELLSARVLYQRIGETTAAEEPETWQVARREAQSELEALRARIPTVRIVATDAVRIWLDGAPLTARGAIELDPGEHEVVARMRSGELVRRRFDVEETERDVSVELGSKRPPEAPPPIPDPESEDPGLAQRRAGIVLMVVGGVLATVGIGTGIGAVLKDGDLEEACTDGVCPEANRGDVDTYYALAHTTTVTLSVGGAALATGVLVYLIAPTNQARLEPWLGPSVAGIRGTFD